MLQKCNQSLRHLVSQYRHLHRLVLESSSTNIIPCERLLRSLFSTLPTTHHKDQKHQSLCDSSNTDMLLENNNEQTVLQIERSKCMNINMVTDKLLTSPEHKSQSYGHFNLLKQRKGGNCRLSCIRCMSSGNLNKSSGLMNLNPVDDLQKYVAIPLLKEEQRVFSPTAAEVHEGEQVFWTAPDNQIRFLKSAVFSEHLPEYRTDMSEVAFIGRSNVGKSSLIQVLLGGQENVHVRTSKTPGHTKLMNFFQVGERLSVVDMPGYGYRMPSNYVEMVEHFLQSRTNLSRTLVVLDGSAGVTETDVIGLNMMEDFQIPYCIVLTKIDKAKPAARIKNLMSVSEYISQTSYCLPQPFLVSSITGEGIPLLQAFIAYVTGNLVVKGM